MPLGPSGWGPKSRWGQVIMLIVFGIGFVVFVIIRPLH
jgi:hypothetical protein